MSKPVVSIVQHEETYQSMRNLLELCDGLKNFKSGDKILIKPNLVFWDFDLPFPPFGVVTTSAVIFALVRLLCENGFTNIAVGEATLGVTGSLANKIFNVLGYEKLRDKYGVKTIDFNEDKFEPVDFNGVTLSIAKEALKADKIISVPVLKTHNQCKVSLGIKNLKGLLNRKSKMLCHAKEEELEHIFPRLLEKIPVALTIIDGIFALAKGPGATGKAYRKDILVASRDVLACDTAGAALLGYNAAEVEHLKYIAGQSGRSLDLSGIEVRGEELGKHASFIEYDWEWSGDGTVPAGFEKRGITGLVIRKYDSSLCTSCSRYYNPMLILLMSAFKGEPFPGVEVVTGKRQTAAPGYEKTVLFGKCAYLQNKDNPDIKKAIIVKGCPPDLNDFVELLAEEGIHCDYEQYVKYRHHLYRRYLDKKDFDLGLYTAP